jgi:starch synthase
VRVLFATAEFSPFVRTGGLGDAVAGLAGALARLGHDVTVAVPGYGLIEEQGEFLDGTPWRRLEHNGLGVVFFQDARFDRPGVYGPAPGAAYDDNWQRFGAFSLAVGKLAPGYDLVHLHDSHVGGAALVVATPSLFTIHNASYPMLGPLRPVAELLGLDEPAMALGGALEWFGQANYLKAGIVGADQVTTVSPGHAHELTVDETSFGLAGLIRSLPTPIIGILNGIDTVAWDPESDPDLPAPFSAERPRRRAESKKLILSQFGLNPGFLLGNVGRMAPPKGLQLLDHDLDQLIDEGARLVLVGNGELDPMLDRWVERRPKAVAHAPYSEPLARLVSAGSDAYVMPSQFEPCGLGQMYAMRYGSPPIAHFTGGLEDTVVDIDEDPDNGTGFVFRSFGHASLAKSIRRAHRYYADVPHLWDRIRHAGMTRDWSWGARAREYAALYERVLG